MVVTANYITITITITIIKRIIRIKPVQIKTNKTNKMYKGMFTCTRACLPVHFFWSQVWIIRIKPVQKKTNNTNNSK
jgi:hypothetical protein